MDEGWQSYIKIFVDDILIMGTTHQDCKQKVELILATLEATNKSATVSPIWKEANICGLTFSEKGYRIRDDNCTKLRNVLRDKPTL